MPSTIMWWSGSYANSRINKLRFETGQYNNETHTISDRNKNTNNTVHKL